MADSSAGAQQVQYEPRTLCYARKIGKCSKNNEGTTKDIKVSFKGPHWSDREQCETQNK